MIVKHWLKRYNETLGDDECFCLNVTRTRRKKPRNPLRLSFDEASTAFRDTLSLAIYDPLHSEEEDRIVLFGSSHKDRLLVIVHTEKGDNIRLISARKASKKKDTKRMQKDPDMLEEYDFSQGVRGKYAKRYAKGTNVVVIEPDMAKVFPDHDSVNRTDSGSMGQMQALRLDACKSKKKVGREEPIPEGT